MIIDKFKRWTNLQSKEAATALTAHHPAKHVTPGTPAASVSIPADDASRDKNAEQSP
jgi:hypothetical protein